MITFTIQLLICELNCSQPTHVDHVCSGVFNERAGIGSGTVTFGGTICDLTITDIPEIKSTGSKTVDNRLNIVGVRGIKGCDSANISIDSINYCVDESIKDTVINVTNHRMKFSVLYPQAAAFTLRYYSGKPRCSLLYAFPGVC